MIGILWIIVMERSCFVNISVVYGVPFNFSFPLSFFNNVSNFSVSACDESDVSCWIQVEEKNLEIIGSFATPSIMDVFVTDSHSYIADRVEGLKILDISNNKSEISLVGNYSTKANGVQVVGNYAYLSSVDSPYGLHVVDIEEKSDPKFVGGVEYETFHRPILVRVFEDYLYLLDQGGLGVKIFDIQNFSNPILVGQLEIGNTVGIFVSDEIGFVACLLAGVSIVNLTNKSDPFIMDTIAGNMSCSGFGCDWATDVYVVNEFLYIADGRMGLKIFDISDVSNPEFVGWMDGNEGETLFAENIIVKDSYAYVTDWNGKVQIIDISNSTLPVVVENHLLFTDPRYPFDILHNPNGIFVSEDNFFVYLPLYREWDTGGGLVILTKVPLITVTCTEDGKDSILEFSYYINGSQFYDSFYFHCVCGEGWSGNDCSTPICDPTCVNGKCIGPNSCQCDVGFEVGEEANNICLESYSLSSDEIIGIVVGSTAFVCLCLCFSPLVVGICLILWILLCGLPLVFVCCITLGFSNLGIVKKRKTKVSPLMEEEKPKIENIPDKKSKKEVEKTPVETIKSVEETTTSKINDIIKEEYGEVSMILSAPTLHPSNLDTKDRFEWFGTMENEEEVTSSAPKDRFEWFGTMENEEEVSAPTLHPSNLDTTTRIEIFGDEKIAEKEVEVEEEEEESFLFGKRYDHLNTVSRVEMYHNNLSEISQVRKEEMLKHEFIIPFDQLNIDYKKCIGKGSFGTIFMCEWKFNTHAVKLLNVKNMTQNVLEEFICEASILTNLRSPNLVSIFAVVIETGKYALVMEYVERGSLYKILHDPNQPLSLDQKNSLGMDIGKGILCLHERNILHRDLKSLNVLVKEEVNSKLVAKLCDFGLSTIKSGSGQKGIVGTVEWIAPELFFRREYTQKSDIYSYGIILWELITRKVPYGEITKENMVESSKASKLIVEKVKRGERLKLPTYCPIFWREIIQKCCDQNPDNRPEIIDIMNEFQNNVRN